MSVGKRDTLFPPSSIGRTQGTLLPRTNSRESLTAHPLLSPTLPGSSASSISSASSASVETTATPVPATRYVPYTPRQRVPSAAITTGTTQQSSVQASPQHHSFTGDATTKLQLMNLKAAAQKGGLDSASTGWAILEKLGTETDHGAEWNEIWQAISVAKATLLLPLEAQPTNDVITTEFLKDHIALWDGTSRNNAPVVTLSGLRGTMTEESMTIRSSIDTSSKSFKAIFDPTTRTSALAALPPLPLPIYETSSPDISSSAPSSPPPPLPTSPKTPAIPTYPTFGLTSHHPSLPLPPRPAVAAKPPLPPRPRPGAPTAAPAASRLSNPFASLFGRAATPTPPASPTTAPSALYPPPSSSPTDTQTVQHGPEGTEHVLGVPAFTLSRRIVRRDVARSVIRTIHAEIRLGLVASGAPGWVAERIEEFAERERLQPFFKVKGGRGKPEETPHVLGGYAIGMGVAQEEGMQEVGRKFQEFYEEIEDQLEKRKWKGRPLFGQRLARHLNNSSISSSADSGSGDEKGEKESINEDGDDTEKESDVDDKPEKPTDEREQRIREVVEAVERTMCSVFYDRLFLQPFADDATHDEALSSRIAAVNLLDLTLSHLGVDVGHAAKEVDAVVKEVGQILTQLDSSCRAPADKAALLVASHKVLVDGLSRLPPINLKPDGEIVDDKTPRAGSFGRTPADEEEEDDEEDPPLDPAARVLDDAPAVMLSPESENPPATVAESPLDLKATLPVEERTLTVPSRSPSPRLTISPPPPPTLSAPTPVSGDIILPLMIFAAVKANPPHLVSHLLYTQRFRHQATGGEESYCLINLMAVAEFLENVDLAALGLGESEKNVISTAELSPITIRGGLGSEPTSPHSVHASLRGRVEQGVDAIAGSANKVISGVVDSSFGVLRALLPGQAPDATGDPNLPDSAPWNAQRPGFGILRRDTGFSIASLAASLPGRAKTPVQKDEEAGQQLVEVPSRPGSIRSARGANASSEEEESEEEDEEDEEEEEHDTRSIRSFESMMSSKRKRRRVPPGRKSLADRLASVPGLGRLSHNGPHDGVRISPPASRRASLLQPQVPTRHATEPIMNSSRAASPVAIRISPPNPRFLEATEDDLKISEVGELLREYKRLVEAVRAMGGFHEDA